jgi:hypothetical protein
VVIFVIEIDNLEAGSIYSEREPPVPRQGQAPDPLAIAGKLMRFPAWHAAQLCLVLHVLKERDDLAKLGDNRSRQARGVVFLDEAPCERRSGFSRGTVAQPLYTVKLRYTDNQSSGRPKLLLYPACRATVAVAWTVDGFG